MNIRNIQRQAAAAVAALALSTFFIVAAVGPAVVPGTTALAAEASLA